VWVEFAPGDRHDDVRKLRDRLKVISLADLEVLGGEVRYKLTLSVGDDGVDRDELDTRSERWPRLDGNVRALGRLLNKPGRHRQPDEAHG
jgi:hypothetical protein